MGFFFLLLIDSTCTYTSSCNFSKHLYISNLYREDFYSKKQMSQWSKYTCRAPNVVGHFLICDLSQKTLVIDTTKVQGLLGGKYNNNSSRSWINRFYNTMYLHDIFVTEIRYLQNIRYLSFLGCFEAGSLTYSVDCFPVKNKRYIKIHSKLPWKAAHVIVTF